MIIFYLCVKYFNFKTGIKPNKTELSMDKGKAILYMIILYFFDLFLKNLRIYLTVSFLYCIWILLPALNQQK
jgi:hypothetical protein